MKKFILVAALGIIAATYQPAKAQVSISLNIGTPTYGYNSYYAPAPVVYVEKHHRNYYQQRNVVAYRVQPTHRTYYTNYRPANRYYAVKQVNYKHYNKSKGHSKGHVRGKH